MIEPSIAAFAMGAVVGAVLGLTGAGGGILAVPMLVFGLHLPMREAAPIGLIAVGVAAGIAAVLGLKEGVVRYRAAALIGAVGMLLAPFGVALARVVPNAPLMVAFAIVLAWVGVRMLRHATTPPGARRNQPPCVMDPREGRLKWTAPCAGMLAGTGVLSGLLSGLLGVGGGFVIVPALTHFTDIATKGIVATSLAVIALVSVSGVAAAAAQGAIAWTVALPFAAGSVAALLAVRGFFPQLDRRIVDRAFAAVCMITAAIMLLRAGVAQPFVIGQVLIPSTV